jgi:hypothetical protein
MTAKRQTARYKRIERQIADMRELAFGRPENSPYSDADYLEIERDSIVRARVLLDCALVEEMSALIIMNHVLASDPKFNETTFFGRLKRYYVFYDDVLGRLPARFKMSVVKKFIRVPRQVSQTVERMLALRDVFAHVCTLDYSRRKNLEYKGHNILSETGFAAYVDDSRDATAFLIEHSRVLQPPTKRSSSSGSVSDPTKAESSNARPQ